MICRHLNVILIYIIPKWRKSNLTRSSLDLHSRRISQRRSVKSMYLKWYLVIPILGTYESSSTTGLISITSCFHPSSLVDSYLRLGHEPHTGFHCLSCNLSKFKEFDFQTDIKSKACLRKWLFPHDHSWAMFPLWGGERGGYMGNLKLFYENCGVPLTYNG